MITTILSKVLDELQKPSPDLSYIRGMVEVLLASQPNDAPTLVCKSTPVSREYIQPGQSVPPDEGSMLDAEARAKIAQIQALAAKSTELA